MKGLLAGALAVLLLGVCGEAVALTPRPVPGARSWEVEGFADLFAMTMHTGNYDPPFGIDPTIVGDDLVDFSAGIIARFDAPDLNGDGLPDDGTYPAGLPYFRVRIGNANWDETMPNSGMELLVERGSVAGLFCVITYTMPSHPDLEFMLPASPGPWRALDERDGHNAGSLEGTYALRDGVVPEPATLALVGLGAAAGMAARRRRR